MKNCWKTSWRFSQISVLVILFSVCVYNLHSETIELTLEQATGLGLKNSSSLRTKMLSFASAGADVQAAKSLLYTDVSMSVSYSHLFEQPEMEDFGIYISPQDPIAVELNAQQSVYTFGKIKNGIRLAEEGLESARLDLEEEKRSLVMAIKRAFYGYILAREVLAVQEETLLNKQEALKIARMRFEAGLGTELEVLSVESDVENFIPEVISARNEVDFAILAVMDLLELDRTEGEYDIVLVGELIPDYHIFKKSELIELALKNNYDIQQYKTGISAAEIQQNLATRERFPTIAAFANYSVQSGFDSTTGENRYSGRNSWSDLLTVGVALQMPLSALFPWSSQNVNAKKSEFDVESLQTGLSSVEGKIKLTIQNLLLQLEEEKAKIMSGEKRVAVAKRFLEMSEKSFANGLISSTDLKDAQLNLNAAQLGHLSAIFNYNLALYNIYDAIGVDHL